MQEQARTYANKKGRIPSDEIQPFIYLKLPEKQPKG
jgi:hypothetical protein